MAADVWETSAPDHDRPAQPGGGGASAAGGDTCFLCGRPLGTRVQWHHPVPKSKGGRETAPVHPICHSAIHAALGNKQLQRDYASPEALRVHPELAKFIAWVRDKDPDFHASTRRKR